MSDPVLRSRLRREAAKRRATLPRWDSTVDAVEAVVQSSRLVGASS
ncbi:MAG TPA: hypothetical protein VFR40_00585 [Lapillicoccus sp.]|nr:hypothetical protein [Lapillicoccus sp.]